MACPLDPLTCWIPLVRRDLPGRILGGELVARDPAAPLIAGCAGWNPGRTADHGMR